MKSKVLVTGANGQLGKTIRELSTNFAKSIDFVFVERSELDITNSKSLALLFKTNHFNYCINCAAYTNVDLAESEIAAAIDINANAVKNLAENCKTYNTTLIHISTDYVFDGQSTRPYNEDDPTQPINAYGTSKLLGEDYIRKHLDRHFIIRTSWLYSTFNKNFVKTIFNKLKNDKKLTIITSQKGTPTSCVDLSNFIMFLIINRVSNFGIYHFSAEGETTWHGLALHIAQLLGKTSNVSAIKDYPSKAKRPLYSVLNTKKAEQLIKKPLNNWKASVDEVIKSLSTD
ncbi:dTDP-4-dehydrorhamnose reductase [Psychroserpens luteolus]|uniref:dTDP-4-dehydrorhamnose reductase n=1 Tax=Psychroserpens luteolus TaxID=2855840 RepID=UPI001E5C9400|nr:dTDP-4-dehydrorhamnose reductase [Psychroserpens luteolus]MCD2258247.1 dTDP-4-dehydrorhamnose reductase [Psychroserpens luteolus]